MTGSGREQKMTRRHSEPSLFPTPSTSDHSENSVRSLDTVSVRRKMNRRRSHGSRSRKFDEHEKQGKEGHVYKVLVTWREMVTGMLLLSAFLTCLSVFFLLGDESQIDPLQESTSCESRTFSPQRLLSYLANKGGDGEAELAPYPQVMHGTCSYSFHICSDSPNLAATIENMETILYILLVGALLTVVGVTGLFYDETEDAMLQLWTASQLSKSNSRSFMTDLSDYTSWTGHASFRRNNDNAMADLFPDTSVLFAEILGFEAWSSQREPIQCLTLLETAYHAFDCLAKKQGIFKVEAVADCYTAAAGLPEPRTDHAEALLQFAHDCRMSFKETTKALEVTLGPDTSDLSLRVGIHR
jgi:Adenylate and Guanylate cyclase catalytic domain